jgi:hypothetical protein
VSSRLLSAALARCQWKVRSGRWGEPTQQLLALLHTVKWTTQHGNELKAPERTKSPGSYNSKTSLRLWSFRDFQT